MFSAMMVAALLVSGMGVALLGSVKLPLAERLHIDEARVGGLVSLFGFTMIPVIFLAGFLTDLVGKQVVLVAGATVFAGSLGLLGWARSYGWALAGVLLLSAGWSLLVNVGNVLTPFAFPGDLAYATNLANVFFGLGAFLTPLAVAFLVSRSSLPRAVSLLGLLALVPALLALGVDFGVVADAPKSEAATSNAGFSQVVGDGVMWLCALALFFYAPLEASMGAWATTYLGDQGFGKRAASGLLSGFWLAFMAARLVTALLVTVLGLPAEARPVLILALALVSVVVLAVVVLGRGGLVAAATVIAAGLVFGPIFPTIMAVVLGHFDASLHGRAVGWLFTIGGLGWTIVPMLIGAYARRTSVQRGFAFAVASAAGLAVVAILLMRT